MRGVRRIHGKSIYQNEFQSIQWTFPLALSCENLCISHQLSKSVGLDEPFAFSPLLSPSHLLLKTLQSHFWHHHKMLIILAKFNNDIPVTSSKQTLSVFCLDLSVVFGTVVFSILLEIVPSCSFYDLHTLIFLIPLY